jgi:hypothetical protein
MEKLKKMAICRNSLYYKELAKGNLEAAKLPKEKNALYGPKKGCFQKSG